MPDNNSTLRTGDGGYAVTKVRDLGDGTMAPSVYVENITSGATATVKFASVAASSTNNTLVAAVSGKKIRVVQAALNVTADSVVKFQSGTGGTDLTDGMTLYANAPILSITLLAGNNGQLLLSYSANGWFETAASTLLNLNKSGGNVNGVIGYVEV